ncbi:thiamine phosphate synthase [filamentous cyanobacterium LEGE 11480]|uniref:Thiamine-phosphate synthase n=1 Tax=Romeriopsis navalis LEGE 11480 TaxID=2777977 RepID=A0A928VNA2_9CYAN|nr:thiamine phosphate synthase [Romeriopsis navalis]MBE9029635.1 thiamine phosphate synthase [Romeriopsis navalis LEGE 11480]
MERAVLRILDANLDRAREGLRVIEEWCRFGLERTDLTDICKHLRQQLGQWHLPEIRAARDTPGDPGTQLTHAQEAQREDISQVLLANFARVQESLRVLEEYGKVYRTDLAAAVKQIRYQVYTLESTMTQKPQMPALLAARLYLVTAPVPNLLHVVEAALNGGLRLLQYRDKEADNATRYENATKLKFLCKQYGAVFIINDHIDLALAVDADGVHLGQQDYPIEVARRLLGPEKIVGRSTTNPTELQRAIDEQADYIGVGPVYETPTKAGKAAAGHEYVAYAQANAPMPWYAIGGVDAENLGDVIAAGAARASVVRAIMQADDPKVMTQQLVAQLAQAPSG